MKRDIFANRFKRVMGFIYLALFLGMMGWKFNSVVDDSENPAVITFLSVIVLLLVLWAVFRILREE